jgi:hypothetical protein
MTDKEKLARKRQYQAEWIRRKRAGYTRNQDAKREAEARMNEAAVSAMLSAPVCITASDILHAPADRAARWITDILKGRKGMAGT